MVPVSLRVLHPNTSQLPPRLLQEDGGVDSSLPREDSPFQRAAQGLRTPAVPREGVMSGSSRDLHAEGGVAGTGGDGDRQTRAPPGRNTEGELSL